MMSSKVAPFPGYLEPRGQDGQLGKWLSFLIIMLVASSQVGRMNELRIFRPKKKRRRTSLKNLSHKAQC